ncbi:hypothetical protein A3749_15485 [Oleiphilus sp. HI0078]|jgi:hypothetical protein|nr:hypothetical protein A3729_17580 [Oleiphilus sp. HI0043]KZY41559.1 hypothetical protein A3732_17965 [Oleiphilus sp. HI0050]KZY58901.1 hypothetical protein A3735_16765 [Oleiphilus sp. HI0061]KZY75291.1 hypothetical protein A3741_12495 [Oleiphilus sp. HI0069]KZY76288.1 hypothetical protein A3740_13125 [Oleiphilus sp. HI0068]KZY86671.1 hypothetical protein A3743_16555 [Oleiphilus sp. HI0072]KZZ07454.1 hypothetical protein A3749_15485 [Oleiphilus sp. HI0078]KZZ34364.1 hypothetical protein A37
MFELIFTFFQPYVALLAIFLTFPFILQFLNSKYLKGRFKRFGIVLFSTLLVFSYWLLNIAFFSESDVAALLPKPENVQIGPEHQTTIDTVHTGSQVTTFALGSVFSIFYLVFVYLTWLVFSLLSRPFRDNST